MGGIALPRITIVTATYYPNVERGQVRADMASIVVNSWLTKINYRGELAIHIADDGSELPNYEVKVSDDRYVMVTRSRQERRGVGASLNKGFEKAFSSSLLAMFIHDDALLREDIDLTPWAELLLTNEDIGMVRIDFPHPGLTGQIIAYPQGWALLLDRHNFAFSHRPALFHKRFFDAYGWFEEGISAVECERIYNVNFCEAQGPEIIHTLRLPWEHLRTIDLGELNP